MKSKQTIMLMAMICLTLCTARSQTTSPANQPPVFTTNVLAHTNLVGSANTFVAAATGTAPIVYQWRFNGALVANAPFPSLTVRNIRETNAGIYSLTASNVAGVAVSANVLTVALDLTPPEVAFVNLPNGTGVVSNRCTIAGTTADNSQVTNVSYSLNGGPFRTATTASQWQNWSAVLDGQLVAGTNIIAIRAQDFSGNLSVSSAQTIREIFHFVPAMLTVRTNGSGTFGPRLDQSTLYVGKEYSISAASGLDRFTNWLVGSTLIPNATITFQMQSNLVIQANFVPNPFTEKVIGAYSGLFYDPKNATVASTGFLQASVDVNGNYTAFLHLAGGEYYLNGSFDLNGAAKFTVPRSELGASAALSVNLQLDLVGGSGTLTGSVRATDNSFYVPFIGDRPVMSVGTNAGVYTFVIPGHTDPAQGPRGYGFGTINVSSSAAPWSPSLVTWNLTPGDGAVAVQRRAVGVSRAGIWPWYASLYKGHGVMFGWVGVGSATGRRLTGNVTVIADPGIPLFPNGFRNVFDLSASSSAYVAPLTGQPAIKLPTNAVILLDESTFAAPLKAGISLNTKNLFTVTPVIPQFGRIDLVPRTGEFSGWFVNPVSHSTNLFRGILLQDRNAGYGEFLDLPLKSPGVTNTGGVYFGPKP